MTLYDDAGRYKLFKSRAHKKLYCKLNSAGLHKFGDLVRFYCNKY